MVVEDNDLNRKLFCDVLRANGFEVEPVAEGDKVLDTARATSPDLIIMDIQMPHVTGLELTQSIRAETAPSANTGPTSDSKNTKIAAGTSARIQPEKGFECLCTNGASRAAAKGARTANTMLASMPMPKSQCSQRSDSIDRIAGKA